MNAAAVEPSPITITTTITTTPGRLAEYLEDAWPGVRLWAADMSFGRVDDGELDPAGFTVDEMREDGAPATTLAVSWQRLAEALGIMAGGEYVDHDGSRRPLLEYHVAGARTILTGDERGDYDSHTWDLAIQIAALGRVVYG